MNNHTDKAHVGASSGAVCPGAPPQREERSQEAAILASLPLGLFVLDRQDRFTYLNPYAERFFAQVAGRRREQLLGNSIWEACPEVADSAFAREYQRAAAEGRDFELEVFSPPLGRWLSLRAALAGDYRPFYVQDVAARVELERAARRSAEELAEAEGGREEFLVRLAHRLRNSLVPIGNALHLMLGDADREMERASALGQREVQQLSRLADDLLKVAHVNAGRLPCRPRRFDLGEMIAQILDAGDGRGRSVTVSLPEEPLEVLADPQLTRDALTHLLQNAIRFTAPGGQIRLTAEGHEDAVELSVRDNGVGISPELLPRVFDLFMRMDPSEDRAHGEGLGVGLTLVRRLVELQGGTVAAHSAGTGRGSEFLVRLPAAVQRTAPPGRKGAGARGAPRSPLKVLVVDNDRETAQSITLLLDLWGYEARACYDGDAALREAVAWRPDVVLLDIGMPGMNGYEVAGHLRSEEGLRGLVLMALTGYGQDEDRQHAQEAGFDCYLVKPVPPAMLQALLSRTATALAAGLSHSSV